MMTTGFISSLNLWNAPRTGVSLSMEVAAGECLAVVGESGESFDIMAGAEAESSVLLDSLREEMSEREAPARESHTETATLLEVRAHDRRGLVWTVCDRIASLGLSIRSAHMSTYGEEVRDVFYVVDGDGQRLDDAAA